MKKIVLMLAVVFATVVSCKKVEAPAADVVEEEMPVESAQPSEEDMMKKKIEEMQKQLDELIYQTIGKIV